MKTKKEKFKRYKNSLTKVGNKIFSYETQVAEIQGKKLIALDWQITRDWNGKMEVITSSPTTSKHINYVAEELNLTLIK